MNRPQVELITNQATDDFETRLTERELAVKKAANVNDACTNCDPESRAAVWILRNEDLVRLTDQNVVTSFRSLTKRYGNFGALVTVFINEAEDSPEGVSQHGRLQLLAKYTGVARSVRFFRSASDLSRMLNLITHHDPGRALGPVEPIGNLSNVSKIDKTLLRRAFNDCLEVALEELPGGTHSKVWLARVKHQKGFLEPFAVKIASCESIESERENEFHFARELIPFPHRAPVVDSRCVNGTKTSLVASMFVERATRLDEYISSSSPKLAIDALFDGPLRTYLRTRFKSTISLGTELRRYGMLWAHDEPALVACHASLRSSTVSSPRTLLDDMGRMKPIDVQTTFAHGDLHVRNIYVRDNALDVILIDFAKACYQSPATRDLATLDVSLALDFGDCGTINNTELGSAYAPGILARDVSPSVNRRLQAISELRKQAHFLADRVEEYDVFVAAQLMRMSRVLWQHDHQALSKVVYQHANALLASAFSAIGFC